MESNRQHSICNVEKLNQLNEEYKKIFGEYYPLMLVRHLSIEEIVESIENCIKYNKPYKPHLKKDCLY